MGELEGASQSVSGLERTVLCRETDGWLPAFQSPSCRFACNRVLRAPTQYRHAHVAVREALSKHENRSAASSRVWRSMGRVLSQPSAERVPPCGRVSQGDSGPMVRRPTDEGHCAIQPLSKQVDRGLRGEAEARLLVVRGALRLHWKVEVGRLARVGAAKDLEGDL